MISACVRVQFLLAQRQRERERERHAAFDPNCVLYISRGKQASVNRSVNAPVATSGKNTSVNTPVNTLLRISKNKAATPAARDFNRCTPFFCLASGQPFSSIFERRGRYKSTFFLSQNSYKTMYKWHIGGRIKKAIFGEHLVTNDMFLNVFWDFLNFSYFSQILYSYFLSHDFRAAVAARKSWRWFL